MSGHWLRNAEGYVKRGRESFEYDPRLLKIKEGFNAREEIGNDADDISLKEFIRENGPLALPSLLVQRQNDDSLLVRDGHRRLWACMELINEGVDLRSVPVQLVDKNMTDEQASFLIYTSNQGKALNPFEESKLFNRQKNYGYSIEEIAKRIGRSVPFVYERLRLINATSDTREAVKNGSVGITAATKAVSSSGGDEGRQKQAIRKAIVHKNKLRVVWNKRNDCFEQKGDATDIQNSLIGSVFTDEFLGDLESAGLDPETVKFSISQKE